MLGLVLFGVENFDARYFFGCKISGSCIFFGSQYEAPSDLPVMYTASTPPWAAEVVRCSQLETHYDFKSWQINNLSICSLHCIWASEHEKLVAWQEHFTCPRWLDGPFFKLYSYLIDFHPYAFFLGQGVSYFCGGAKTNQRKVCSQIQYDKT